MTLDDLMAFFFVFVRVGCVFAFLPLLGQGSAPKVIKAMVILVLSLAIFPVAGVRVPFGVWQPYRFFTCVGAEVLLGLLVGLAARLIFSALRTSGELIGRQMGLALAITADPVTGVQATPIGNFCELVGVLVFFSVGGHHWMIAALYDSFAQWQVGALISSEFIRNVTVATAGHSFLLALQIAAPLLLLTFLVTLVMALMARLVPEVNVLIVGFPLRVGVGLVGLTLFVPLLVRCGVDVSRTMLHFISGVAAGG